MISYLKGVVLQKGENFAVLLCQGVGYKVFVGEQALASLQEGQEAELWCASRIRGEALELYGTPTAEALQVFEALDKISGVGPKAALSLSSFGSVAELKEALASGRLQVKGIGQKKLSKIMLELSGKLQRAEPSSPTGRKDEALEGLLALGFSRKEAKEALGQVPREIADPEQRIKEALRVLRAP